MIEVISQESLELKVEEFKRIKTQLGESLLRIPSQDSFNRYVCYTFLVDTLKTISAMDKKDYEEALIWELKMRARQYCEHTLPENECNAVEIMVKETTRMTVFEFVTKAFNK